MAAHGGSHGHNGTHLRLRIAGRALIRDGFAQTQLLYGVFITEVIKGKSIMC
jgi:hypothetical protein